MADDKLQLVTRDGELPVEDMPPQYTPTQYVQQPPLPPQQQLYGQPPQVVNPYGQPVVQQPAMPYNQYAQPAPPQHTVVVTQPQTQTVIVTAAQRPPTYMWLACVVYWCCNPLAGTIAFALSIVSANSADENRMEEAKNYGRASMWTSVIGVVLGVGAIIAIIVYIVHVTQEVDDSIHESFKDWNDNNNNNWN